MSSYFSFKKVIGISFALSIFGFAAYGYRRQQNRKYTKDDINDINKINEILNNNPNLLTNTTNPITLYAFHHCPFCSKVEVFLKVNSIPFNKIYVNRINKKEIKDHKYKKVPQMKIDNTLLVDCYDIVSTLSNHIEEKKKQQDNPNDIDNIQTIKWRKWYLVMY